MRYLSLAAFEVWIGDVGFRTLQRSIRAHGHEQEEREDGVHRDVNLNDGFDV